MVVPFITMPQVFTEDIDKPGVMNGNLGMYRIQLAGNEYIQIKKLDLHYQIHRGIGVHQTKANAKGAAKGEHFCWRTAITPIRCGNAITRRII
jgi:UbiD family decarboxylase